MERKYRERHLTRKLQKALAFSPVVMVRGARQTGKTTIMRHLAEEEGFAYVTFDDLRVLSAASGDPVGFVSAQPEKVIFDEVQRAPEIFLPIKHQVDENRQPGMFLLTGSANPLLLPKIGDSLAGRMEVLTLYPFSQGELLGVEEDWIDRLFNGGFESKSFPAIPREDLVRMMLLGGYPQLQELEDAESRELWCQSYITTLLEKDVKDLAHIEKVAHLPNLLQLIATRSGNLLNVAELSRSSGIASTTMHRYLQLLHTLFLIEFLPAWSKNFGKRLTKSPKAFLVDSGLLAFLMGLDEKRLLSNPSLFGNHLENFLITEIRKQASWSRQSVQLSHFRTQTGIEIDLLLENRAGEIIAIEIKSKETVKYDDFKGISLLRKELREKFLGGYVLYPGGDRVSFAKDLEALPLSSLWSP